MYETWKEVKGIVRNSRLFMKTIEENKKVGIKLYHVIRDFRVELQELLASGAKMRSKAGKELSKLSLVMETVLPQILHFLETRFVANKK